MKKRFIKIENQKTTKIVLLTFFLLVLAGLIILLLKEDESLVKCRIFLEKSGLPTITTMPTCNYTLDSIKVSNGSSNEYYCFPEGGQASHFERNTISPFFSYDYSDNGTDILNTNFSTSEDSKYRIIILGDSVSEGAQVIGNKSFSFLLSSMLKKINPNIEVLNSAHGCYSLVNYYHMLTKIINNYDFDYLILGITWNDMGSCWEAIVSKEFLDEKFSSSFNFDTVDLDNETINNICLSQNTPNYFNISKREHTRLSKVKLYRKLVFSLEKFFSTYNYEKPFGESKGENYDYYLNKISELIKLNNIKNTIIIFPEKDSIREKNPFKDVLESHNLTYIDLREESTEYLKFAFNDPILSNEKIHPNAKGHRIIAKLLVRDVLKKMQNKT